MAAFVGIGLESLVLDHLLASGDPLLELSRHSLLPHGEFYSPTFHINPVEELPRSSFPFTPFPLSCSPHQFRRPPLI
jgi:hypothetical protein